MGQLVELTYCRERDKPLHQQPGGWTQASGSLDQKIQANLQVKHRQLDRLYRH